MTYNDGQLLLDVPLVHKFYLLRLCHCRAREGDMTNIKIFVDATLNE